MSNLTLLEAEGEEVGILDEIAYIDSPSRVHFNDEMSTREEILVIKGSIKISP